MSSFKALVGKVKTGLTTNRFTIIFYFLTLPNKRKYQFNFTILPLLSNLSTQLLYYLKKIKNLKKSYISSFGTWQFSFIGWHFFSFESNILFSFSLFEKTNLIFLVFYLLKLFFFWVVDLKLIALMPVTAGCSSLRESSYRFL